MTLTAAEREELIRRNRERLAQAQKDDAEARAAAANQT
jgi:hypothetical protein